MLLGFKQRFAGFVEEGSKTHTIRARRKVRPRVGEVCHCYYALRTKLCRLLGRWTCVKVQEIQITRLGAVRVEEELLDISELNALAWADGFRSRGRDRAWEEMFEYWTTADGRTAKPPELPFLGDIIHWQYKKGTNVR